MTIPLLLAEIRRGNPGAEITILVGMGTHRLPTEDELRSKFGEEVFRRERIILHHGDQPSELAGIGQLPSGYPLEINRRAAEADLLLAEGLVNPHIFAGFSGGAKSILPGIAGHDTIRRNHCGENIAHALAKNSILAGNPVHEEMGAAAELARLAFVLNIVGGRTGQVAAALPGAGTRRTPKGSRWFASVTGSRQSPAPITITSDGGIRSTRISIRR